MNNIDTTKCIACCYINNQNSKTLPLVCGADKTPCLGLEAEWLKPENLDRFLKGIRSNKCNENIPVGSVPRIYMNSPYMDQKYINEMIETFLECQEKGYRVEILESY